MDAAGGCEMKATRIILILALAVLTFCALATTAYAQNYITGNLYRVYVSPYNDGNPMATGCSDPIITALPSPHLVPMRQPDITFVLATNYLGIPLDFDDTYPKSGMMAEAWLTHGSNPSHNVLGLPMYMYANLSDYNPCTYVSVIDIAGFASVTTGEVFSFDVDDNVWLMINGVVITQTAHSPGPYSAPAYTGPNGLFPFRLVYVETNAGHARLKVTHN
jgi:hypothetical protein